MRKLIKECMPCRSEEYTGSAPCSCVYEDINEMKTREDVEKVLESIKQHKADVDNHIAKYKDTFDTHSKLGSLSLELLDAFKNLSKEDEVIIKTLNWVLGNEPKIKKKDEG